MNKLVSCLVVTLLVGTCTAVTKQQKKAASTQATTKQKTQKAAPELTPAEEAACQNVVEALRERYTLLEVDGIPLHKLIEQALQEVADENREDFDTAKQILGMQLEEAVGEFEAGTWVLPIPVHFVLK